MRVGLVCVEAEMLPVPAPAKWLFQSARFSIFFTAAMRECDKVLIVSPKHGLLNPEMWIRPYTAKLADKTKEERDAWLYNICSKLDSKDSHFTYGSKVYQELLQNVAAPMYSGNIGRMNKIVAAMNRPYLEEHPLPDFPSFWILTYIHLKKGKGAALSTLHNIIGLRYTPNNVTKQYNETLECPLHHVEDDRIYSNYWRLGIKAV